MFIKGAKKKDGRQKCGDFGIFVFVAMLRLLFETKEEEGGPASNFVERLIRKFLVQVENLKVQNPW